MLGTYSLRSKFLHSIIKEKQDSIVERTETVDYNVQDKENVVHKSNNDQKSIISKLRDLDG